MRRTSSQYLVLDLFFNKFLEISGATAVTILFSNLMADLIYAVIDPRIKYS